MDERRIYGVSTFEKFTIESLPVKKLTEKRVVVDKGLSWTGWGTHLDRSLVDWNAEDAVARFVARAQRCIETSELRIAAEKRSIDGARAALAAFADADRRAKEQER
jgi:hypothetical protein